jgi:hypothetical protein
MVENKYYYSNYFFNQTDSTSMLPDFAGAELLKLTSSFSTSIIENGFVTLDVKYKG